MDRHALGKALMSAALLLCPCCSSPSFTEIEATRAELIDGFQSYQNPAEVKDILNARHVQFRIEETKQNPPTDRRPPFNVVTIAVADYSHLGASGGLVLEFFNNRLMSARYYPKETGKYLAEMERTKGVKLGQNAEASLGKYTRIWLFQDQAQKQYIGWEDKRLAKELELWIRKYS